MASRHDWLEEGLGVLGEEGAPALTVELLCGRLGLTKGSFYHHFKGMAGFKTELLRHFAAQHTTRYIDAVEHTGGSVRARLDRLLELVLADEKGSGDPEPAIRAWALQDTEVRATQELVDRLRIDYLRSLWHEAGGAEADALPMARMLYLILIGAGQIAPPVPAEELRDVYELAMRLMPDDGKDG
ncbi:MULTISPECIES: TetR/AcrR family transcriptional regulator [Streptosporangium]|uniref:AcrR family transcriptional regulator n=1 Tax=Streptosporangium brasiliense TaxID=47480 RepID=A0ABT9QZL5_9ACTN|nr:TetR/AcrR family transcriptional regulator [Streptosporangium brasiliense]MDP9862421.1 AcrR family transcriptional regulator [Streptosporangium brasiliense]